MMAITQRNLVFAHVTSMRPIEDLETRLGTPGGRFGRAGVRMDAFCESTRSQRGALVDDLE
jgi:hypothetical protein